MLPSINGSPLPGGPDDHTRIVPRTDLIDDRTTLVPIVQAPSRLRTLLPWAGFGVVAVVVVAATTMWASALKGPDDPLLADATPPAAFVSTAVVSAATPTAAPVDETTVPAATTRKQVRPTLAAVVAPKSAPVAVATTTVKPTSAAPITTKAAAATTSRPRGVVGLTPAEACTPSATTVCPAANQAGSTARAPTP